MQKMVERYEAFVNRNALGGQNGLLKRSFYMMIEAGEFCNDVKKHVEYDGLTMPAERHAHMVEELGDTLYYFFLCMATLGVTLEDVMEANIKKLERRYAERIAREAGQQVPDVRQGNGVSASV